MRRPSRFALFLALLIPSYLTMLTLTGCGRGADSDDEDELAVVRPKKDGDKSGGTGGATASGLKPIKIDKTGVIEGVVKLEGNPNTAAMTDDLHVKMNDNQNKAHCLSAAAPAEAKSEYQWVFDGENNLKYAVVFIRPVDPTTFFDVSELAKKAKEVTMDQPYCAFEPHVQVFWPKYIDPQSPSSDFNLAPATLQQFVMKNSAPMPHNTAWNSERLGSTGGGNEVIPPGGKLPIKNIRPSYRGPVQVGCSIHPWMRGYVWALDHPFIAVTDDKGKFKIEGVPAGVKLKLIAWHEGVNFVEGPNGREITVEAGKTTKADFTVKVP